jgi:hypothetical protein
MFALVESGSITRILSGKKGITIGDLQYPKEIFTLWSKAEREAIGIYEIEMDTSKRKDEKWYINTNVTYAFGSGKVTGSYGDASAKDHEDTKWTQKEIDDGEAPSGANTSTVKAEGLKTKLIRDVKSQAASELAQTDWYVVRKADAGTAIPSAISTHRGSVRNKAAEMETKILDANNVAALQTLYTRNSDGVRPLGDIPRLES